MNNLSKIILIAVVNLFVLYYLFTLSMEEKKSVQETSTVVEKPLQ